MKKALTPDDSLCAEKLNGDNYKPVVGGPEVDEALIEEWRTRRNEKRCGGMGDLCTAPCQAFS